MVRLVPFPQNSCTREELLDIVLATRNRKKADELRRILTGQDVSVLTLEDFPDCPEVVEDQRTFEGNAVKKAVAVMTCTGKAAVSDDSGLEVYALGNAPGVLSARYAGDPGNDAANMGKLLDELGSAPREQRGARFVCCICLAMPGAGARAFHGTVEGVIGTEPRGSGGFGYDPVFYPLGFDRTFAEMSPEEKDALSHRRKALELLKECLATIEK